MTDWSQSGPERAESCRASVTSFRGSCREPAPPAGRLNNGWNKGTVTQLPVTNYNKSSLSSSQLLIITRGIGIVFPDVNLHLDVIKFA